MALSIQEPLIMTVTLAQSVVCSLYHSRRRNLFKDVLRIVVAIDPRLPFNIDIKLIIIWVISSSVCHCTGVVCAIYSDFYTVILPIVTVGIVFINSIISYFSGNIQVIIIIQSIYYCAKVTVIINGS